MAAQRRRFVGITYFSFVLMCKGLYLIHNYSNCITRKKKKMVNRIKSSDLVNIWTVDHVYILILQICRH